MRKTVLILLCLLPLLAAWLLWPSARPPVAALKTPAAPPAPAAVARVTATPKTAAAVADPGTRSAASTNRETFRLTNTRKTIGELTRMPHAILLENALIETEGKTALAIPAHLRAAAEPGAYLVQARGVMDAPFRAALAAAGGQIVSYIPNNAYLVQLSGAGAAALTGNPLVQTVLPYAPYYKVQASLLGLAVNQKPLPADTYLTLGLLTASAAATEAQIQQLGGQILGRDRSPFGPVLHVQPPANWLALAQLPGVQRVEPAHRRVTANDLSRTTLGVALTSTTPTNYLNLSGSNVLVEVNDTGIDANHPDLAGRLFFDSPGSGYDTDGHGTFIAGQIAGSGLESITVTTNASGSIITNTPGPTGSPFQFRGMAPAASLFSVGGLGRHGGVNDIQLADRIDLGGNDTNFFVFGQTDFFIPGPSIYLQGTVGTTNYFNTQFPDWYLQEAPAATNALISNNSWNNDGSADYDLSAASYDAAVRDALPERTGPQPVLFVFSAGNDGGGNNFGGGGNSDSILSPATAKNVLTVGSLEQYRNITNTFLPLDSTNPAAAWAAWTDSSSQVASYSARGNVGIGTEGSYGRFKPDVVAPGTFVLSTRSSTWDEKAYYNPTNYHTKVFLGQLTDTNVGAFGGPFQVNVPTNAVAIRFFVVPNALSTTPFPTLDILVSATDGQNMDPADPTTFDFSKTNTTVSIPPDGPANYVQTAVAAGIVSFVVVDTTPLPVNFDAIAEIITTNDNGNYFTVLSNLNNSIGAAPNYYRYETGTSMAAADVSGVLALMQDYFTNTLRTTPSPALLKALLINGARAVGGNEFSVTNGLNYQGWGLVNLPNSIPAALTNGVAGGTTPLFFVDQSPTNVLATGDSRTYNVTVPAGSTAVPLRITLAWTDPPGNPAAAIKLVNNLDLVVTNLSTGQIYYGNNFAPSDPPYSFASQTNDAPVLDAINNVENVVIPATLGTNYSITIIGRDVNVNAVTAEQTNVVQDFVLVVACADSGNTNGISVVAAAPALVPALAPQITYIAGSTTNGIYFNQFAGANAPWLNTNTLGFGTNSPYATNANLSLGQTNQWHFYVVTNTTSFTNAAFVTFIPNTQALPRQGVFAGSDANSTTPEADLNLFVAGPSDPGASGLISLSPLILSNCVVGALGDSAALARGGTKFIAYTNAAQSNIYYVGVECSDQTAAQYGFLAVFSQNPFSTQDANGNVYVNALNVPVAIPDGNNRYPGNAYVLALAIPSNPSMTVRNVIVTNTVTHENFGDLLGTLSHENKYATLNSHDGFSFVVNDPLIYDDSGQGDVPGARHSDGPGSLKDFQGVHGIGLWLMNQVDDSPGATGSVVNLQMKIEPHIDLTSQPFATVSVPPQSWFYDYVDVPVGYTNITVVATNLPPTSVPPILLALQFNTAPTFSNNIAIVGLTNGTVPGPGNSISYGPPLQPGRYWVGLYNPDTISHNVLLGAILSFNASAISTLAFASTGSVPLLDDAVTYAYRTVTNTDAIQGFNVGLRVDHPRISDLVFTLISPAGNRYLLMENRGGQSTNGCGLTVITTNIISATANGNAQPNTNYINVGVTSGSFPITYNFYTAPDQMTVYYGTNPLTSNYLLYDTGMTNNPPATTGTPSPTNTIPATFTVTFPPPGVPANSTWLTIVMNQFSNNATADNWTYTAGGVQTNFEYLEFTEDTNLTTTPIKYATPPFVPVFQTNVVYLTNVITVSNSASLSLSSFDGVSAGAYLAATTVDGWSVSSNQVSVVNDPTNAQSGNQFLALANGSIVRSLPTTIGTTNVLSYAFRGPAIAGFWRGDGNASDAIYGNNGTAQLVTYAPGEVGQAFVFVYTPSPPQYMISIPDQPNYELTNSLSIDGWINPAGVSGNSGIILWRGDCRSGFDPYYFQLNGDNTLNFGICDATGAGTGVSTTAVLSSNQWYHVAATLDGNTGNMSIYINGVLSAQANTAMRPFGPLISNQQPSLGIGNTGTPCWSYIPFNGKLDEISLYSRALSASEINAIYTAGSAGKYDAAAGFPQNLAKALVTVGGVTTNVIFGDNNTWQTNTITFVATSNATAFQFDGLEPGLLLDSVTISGITSITNITTNVVVGASNLTYQPEQDISGLQGTSAYGIWSLEILDNRAGATNNANLVSWDLGFTFANTNFTIPTLNFTNGTGPVTNFLAGGAIQWYLIDVPTNADFATNSLLFATLPLNLWFSTNAPPTTTNAPGDVPMLSNSTGGTAVLGTNGSPVVIGTAFIIPGGSYYLGVQNPNTAGATYAVNVTFHLLPAAPSLLTLAATGVTETNAILNAAVLPNGLNTTVYFEYGLNTNYGLFSASTLLTVNLTSTNLVGIGVTNLLPGTIYHFQAIGTNSLGTNYGGDLTLTNLAILPTVITAPATNILATTATLDAFVNPGGAPTLLYFEYGLSTNGWTNAATTLFSPSLFLTNNLNATNYFGIGVTNLVPGSVYYFQAIATNNLGTNYGGILTFTNPFAGPLPFAFTAPATLANGTNAQLNGFATPNGSAASAWFEWGTSTNYGVITPAVALGTNDNVVFVTNSITGLITNVPYHFHLVVSNTVGVTYGFDQVFDQANVVAWGGNFLGQSTPLPVGLTNLVVGLGAGYDFSLAVNNDGTVAAWGDNTFGQANVPAGLTNAVSVSGGEKDSLALRSDRTVLVWGSNQFKQTNAPANLTNAVAASSGGFHCVALRDDGRPVTWGYNGDGQTSIPAGLSNVVAVAGGDLHTLVLKNDGTVVAWGYNDDGETNVPAGLTNVVAIAAGEYHNLALKRDGTVVAWGDNVDGQTNVPAGLTNVVAVAGGGFHSLALKSDGTVVQWGDTTAGQLNGYPTNLTQVVAIAGGGFHSLALSSIYGLNQTNNAPFWTNALNLSTLTLNELTTLSVTNTATDTNIPAQVLSYLLSTNSPAWAAINAQGVITLSPQEVDGPGTNVVTTIVTDNGRPALSATNRFTVIVNEVNTAPYWPTNIPSQTNYTVNELTLLTVTNTASDSDIPTNGLTYSLSVSSGVTNAAINTNGIITWTPTEAQGPGFYTFTTIVTDTNPPAVNAKSLSATNRFTVTVLEVNTPPFWTNAFPPVTLDELTTNTVVATAQDSDIPANPLTYALTNSPAWASIDTNSGVITLLPQEVDGPGSTNITVIVTDHGVPSLSATTNFTVVVNEVNTAPFWPANIPAQTNYTVHALDTLVVTNTASDSDLPVNPLTYTLSASPVVTNASISANGILTWLPGVPQGSNTTYTFTTIVTDTNAYALTNNALSATNSFTVTVLPPLSLTNALPQTNTIVGGGLTYYRVNVPTNADFATNRLLSATPGALNLWFTTNTPPSITNATDAELLTNATAGQSVLNTSTAPLLVPSAFYWLAVQNTNLVAVTYGLEVDFHLVLATNAVTNAVSIASIVYTTNSVGTNGYLLTWFAPSNDLFHVQWTASLAPVTWTTFALPATIGYNTNFPASATNAQFNFFDDGSQTGGFDPTRFYRLQLVSPGAPPTNTPPVLPPSATLFVTPLSLLTVTNAATDADVPAQLLTYAFSNLVAGTNVPAFDTNTAVITWTPSLAQAGTTNVLTTIVTDNGTPNLSATNVLTIIVNPIPLLSGATLGTNGLMNLHWTALTNEQFKIQWTTNLALGTWTFYPNNISPVIFTSTNGAFSFTDTNPVSVMEFYRLLLLP